VLSSRSAILIAGIDIFVVDAVFFLKVGAHVALKRQKERFQLRRLRREGFLDVAICWRSCS